MTRRRLRPCFFCGDVALASGVGDVAVCVTCRCEERELQRQRKERAKAAAARAGARHVAKERGW